MKAFRTVLVAVAFASLAGTPGFAQDQYLEVVTLRIEPGHAVAFEGYIKQLVEAARKAGITQHWYTFETEGGQPTRTYVITQGFAEWAALDRWTPTPEYLAEAYGKEGAVKFLEGWGASMIEYEADILELVPDVSTHPKAFDDIAPFYSVVRTEVKPDMEADYRLFLALLKAAQEKVTDVTFMRRAVRLGNLSTYVTSRRFSKYAELDETPGVAAVLKQAYGDVPGQRILENGQRCILGRRTMILGYRPELSRPVSEASISSE